MTFVRQYSSSQRIVKRMEQAAQERQLGAVPAVPHATRDHRKEIPLQSHPIKVTWE